METEMKNRILIIILLQVVTINVNAQKREMRNLTGPYFGQKPPGMTPEVFAPGIVSTDASEFSCSFSPEGKSFYFARDRGGISIMFIL